MLTSAYRQDTRHRHERAAANRKCASGCTRVDTERIGVALRAYYDDLERLARRSPLLREWRQTLDAGPTLYGVDEVLLASEAGGQLAPGVYLLRVQGPQHPPARNAGAGRDHRQPDCQARP
ncbi:MAG: hypothetical protein KatS3mg051_1208 [Anaerolineae bacterium]|nr:MAG: hypothetical protein KatS3mg051_1208 [Anaerolineae bacterium]